MGKFKFLILFLSLSLLSTTVFSQEIEKEQVKYKVKKEMKKEVKTDKAKVAIADLPEAIQKKLKESFADFNIKKAYQTSDKGLMYYVKLEKDGKWLKLVIDANGKIIEQKSLEKKEKQSEQKS